MIISKTPLRVSLVGGGTDFESFYEKHGGCVVSMAIDKYVYVIVKERFDNLIVLNYTQHEIAEKVKDIKHDLIRECLQFVGIEGGIEISTLADIPSAGSGLGSSSAIIIGLLNALLGHIGESSDHKELADFACHIEIDLLKNPIGRQDQYACAFGGLNQIWFDAKGIGVIPLSGVGFSITDNLFLHYTEITRQSKSILKEQQNNIENNMGILLHMKELAEQTKEDLVKGNYDQVGEAIGIGWTYKKCLAGNITNPEIDKIIDHAYKSGALGVKLLGAGAGGFVLSYVKPENHIRFRQGMCKYRELPFKIDPYGTRIIFNIL